jgi:hypothetical protein
MYVQVQLTDPEEIMVVEQYTDDLNGVVASNADC